jgi:hypothetical protein
MTAAERRSCSLRAFAFWQRATALVVKMSAVSARAVDRDVQDLFDFLTVPAAAPTLAVLAHHRASCAALPLHIGIPIGVAYVEQLPALRMCVWQFFASGVTVTARERLMSMCTAKVVARLVLAVGCRQLALHPRRSLLLGANIVKRVSAVRVAHERDNLFRHGLALHRACEFAAAAARFDLACKLGHARAHAELSWMLSFGREGVRRDLVRSLQLADSGVRLGCCDCKGALAHCLLNGHGCAKNAALALTLAQQSAAAGSRFGLYMLGKMYRNAAAGVQHDLAAAAELYHAAAEQHLAEAQYSLGLMHQQGLMHQPGAGIPAPPAHALACFV